MIVKCRCCGNLVDIPVTTDEYTRLIHHKENHELVQDIAPKLQSPLREMFISGICPTCWDIMVGDSKGQGFSKK